MPKPLVAVEPTPDLLQDLQRAWAAGQAVAPLPPDADRVRATLRLDRPVDDEVALVLATSGSTGAPKAVELSSAALAAATRASLARLGSRPGDRWLCCLPLHHVAGIAVLLRAAALDTPPIVQPRFDVEAVGRADATHVSLVPTMLARLLDAGADLRRFETVLLGGAPASPALLSRAQAAGVTIVQTYGMTETCGGCVYDGVPLDGVEVAIGDGGRIRLAGPVLFSGYRGGPRHTGWHTTADLGRLDDGRLTVLGRDDDVIITGGEKVSAPQVAALLAGHPAVAEAVVVGRPDREWGERVVAVVVPREPAAPPALAELRALVRARAPSYAAPRELVVVSALPRLPSGKIDRLSLRGG